MTQEFTPKDRRERNPASTTASGKKLPDTRDCGPSVDTWPILDSQGRSPGNNEQQDAGAKKA